MYDSNTPNHTSIVSQEVVSRACVCVCVCVCLFRKRKLLFSFGALCFFFGRSSCSRASTLKDVVLCEWQSVGGSSYKAWSGWEASGSRITLKWSRRPDFRENQALHDDAVLHANECRGPTRSRSRSRPARSWMTWGSSPLRAPPRI